ncbi:MAG: hypothetical protein GXZ11_04180 [Tissierellia bacterium]|nr:hypothetical protein [Tissierellia bacterium]
MRRSEFFEEVSSFGELRDFVLEHGLDDVMELEDSSDFSFRMNGDAELVLLQNDWIFLHNWLDDRIHLADKDWYRVDGCNDSIYVGYYDFESTELDLLKSELAKHLDEIDFWEEEELERDSYNAEYEQDMHDFETFMTIDYFLNK